MLSDEGLDEMMETARGIDHRPRTLTDADIDAILERGAMRLFRRTKMGLGGWLLAKFWQAIGLGVLAIALWGVVHSTQLISSEAHPSN